MKVIYAAMLRISTGRPFLREICSKLWKSTYSAMCCSTSVRAVRCARYRHSVFKVPKKFSLGASSQERPGLEIEGEMRGCARAWDAWETYLIPLGRCGAEVRQQPFPVSEPRGGYPLPARMTCRNRSSTRGQHCHTNPAQRIFIQTRRHFRCSNSRPPFAMAQTRAGSAFLLQRGRRKVCTSQC